MGGQVTSDHKFNTTEACSCPDSHLK